ncbi:MAG: toxin-antitoxin system protein [Muribaculum sp.]|nr:toxin-antitoxin system protein [Muribaculum sp.]
MELSLRKPTMFRLRTDLIDRLKMAARRENRSLNNYVESVLMDVVYSEPNEETCEAIEAVKRGEYAGVIDTSSLDAMIKSIVE